ncbi:N-acetyltransferase family protein [Nocardioides sp. DS6]|uniref:N-acetyltransferase family protein n=1 Tax=Nocardioides eburneus TaxID=3231482 RepID=A0ABV3SZP6_9ACTN
MVYTAARVAAVPFMPVSIHTSEEDHRHFAEVLADGDRETWVAEVDGTVVAFVVLTPTWVNDLFVHPDQQRAGLGSALLAVVKSLCPDGFGLWVFESNTPARAFYARHGLVEMERTDGADNEERAPDIRMEWRPVAAA